MRISELAKRTDCLVETIRYYEQEGLLPEPARTSSNFRDYDESHIEQLTFIRRCRSLDMALSEIRTLLAFRSVPDENCEQVNVLLDEHIEHVAERIAELTHLELQLRELRDKCQGNGVTEACNILSELASEESLVQSIQPSAKNHVHKTHGKGRF